MTVFSPIWGRPSAAFAVCAALAGCGLPRSGPNKAEILASDRDGVGAVVVDVDDRVARAAAATALSDIPQAFLAAGPMGSDAIRPGDRLALSVWENVEDGLLDGRGGGASGMEEVQVDGSGFIFVPYAGRIRAAGNTPEAVRRIVTDRLSTQTPDPQVVVSRVAGDGATVSVIGDVGAQGVYPIERPTRTLSAMLAEAGGVTIPAEMAQISVVRGTARSRIWLTDLYENPEIDIALRAGDRVLVEADERYYTAMGATGTQRRVPFETRSISAMEAIATVGGLNPSLADPTGIFVLRTETEAIAEAVTGQDHDGDKRMVYVIDLTGPGGIFLAREFEIHDRDTVYVTEAPYSQFVKVLSAVIAPLNSANTVERLTE